MNLKIKIFAATVICLALAQRIWELDSRCRECHLYHRGLQDLPLHHKDPFDRLLIAQAKAEDAVLISHDPLFAKYPVRVLW